MTDQAHPNTAHSSQSLRRGLRAAVILAALSLPAAAAAGEEQRAPDAPSHIQVEGGEGWKSKSEFTVSWSNPDHPVPIKTAYYRLCPVDGQRACEDNRHPEDDAERLRISLPAPGDYTLSVWLKDERGRVDPGNRSRVVHLRFDPDPPTSPGIELGADGDPAKISLSVSDKLSGVGEAEIELRSSLGQTRSLPVELTPGSGELTARIPDLELPAGSYEVRAMVHDLAGNLAVIDQDTEGATMTVTLPLRERTGIAATAEIVRVVRRCRRVMVRSRGRLLRRTVCTNVPTRAPVPLPTQAPLRVGHFERLLITGALENAPEAAMIDVVERPRTPGLPGRSSRVPVGGDGRFSVPLPPGPSRTVELSYAGDAENLSSRAEVALLVPAASTLTPSRTSVVNGQAVVFSGRLLGGPMPEMGRTVDLQAFYRGAWRTFATPRSDDAGAWRHVYRFGATRGTVVYPFRVLIQREAGYPYETGVSRTVRVTVRGR